VLVDSKVGEVGGTRLRRRVNNLGLGRAETAGRLESMGDSDKGGFFESKHERVGLELTSNKKFFLIKRNFYIRLETSGVSNSEIRLSNAQ